MKRYVCIHGHFYQPPREDPWREVVPRQPSAHPFHDWNHRITEECYAPNGAARILDGEGKVARIVNNYAYMSYNFGPTLLSWLKRERPEVYETVVRADQRSIAKFGYGSAVAQAYNHAILPLASARDKTTQVLWGIRDFESHYHRRPQGMWLPETAVDTETLRTLADAGIEFTILAQRQGQRVRRDPTSPWQDVTGGRIDPRRPYRVSVGDDRFITVFFYDDVIARGVAFEGLLDRGEAFAYRLAGGFDWTNNDEGAAQLVHIATDGESYGHHHRHGEMALADALVRFDQRDDVELTNYATFLSKHPATWQAEIIENSSWSCIHGIERWRSDCGCGGSETNTQAWRGPLRHALDELRDQLAQHYETASAGLISDPWQARDNYIEVVLDPSEATASAVISEHVEDIDDADTEVRARRLLEMQRHAMLMYTSCAWFFEEITRPEPIQVLRYAERAIQLAERTGATGLSEQIRLALRAAPTNVDTYQNAEQLWTRVVHPSRVELADVVAHYGASYVFLSAERASRLYGFEVEAEDVVRSRRGRRTLAVGRVRVTSLSTRAQSRFMFAFLHLGDHNVSGGVGRCEDDRYEAMRDAVMQPFEVADVAATLRAVDEAFSSCSYSLNSLFPDEQHEVISGLLETAFDEATVLSRRLFEKHEGLLRHAISQYDGHVLPKTLQAATDFLLNARLAAALAQDKIDIERVRTLIHEAALVDVTLDAPVLTNQLADSLNNLANQWNNAGGDEAALGALVHATSVLKLLPFSVNLFFWDGYRVQNVAWRIGRAATTGELKILSASWYALLDQLAAQLGMALPTNNIPGED